ncbi:MAG: hypothetical protein R3F20_07715 [Planctomycetota bacterium]
MLDPLRSLVLAVVLGLAFVALAAPIALRRPLDPEMLRAEREARARAAMKTPAERSRSRRAVLDNERGAALRHELDRARAMAAAGRPEDAAAAFRRAHVAAPLLHRARRELAVQLLAARRWAEAEAVAVDLAADDADAWEPYAIRLAAVRGALDDEAYRAWLGRAGSPAREIVSGGWERIDAPAPEGLEPAAAALLARDLSAD